MRKCASRNRWTGKYSGRTITGDPVQTRTYKNHTIALDFSYDIRTRRYGPMADIIWNISEADQGRHFLNSNERCTTSLYALAVALDEATSWIDRRLFECDDWPTATFSILKALKVGSYLLEWCILRAGEIEVLKLPRIAALAWGWSIPNRDRRACGCNRRKSKRGVDLFGADRIILNPDCGFVIFTDTPVVLLISSKASCYTLAQEEFRPDRLIWHFSSIVRCGLSSARRGNLREPLYYRQAALARSIQVSGNYRNHFRNRLVLISWFWTSWVQIWDNSAYP